MGLVHDHEVERIDRLENGCALGAARQLAVSEEHARAGKRLRVETAFARLDAEERVELGLPLAEQRLGHDEQYAPHALGHQLRDDQPGLDGLAEAHLVGKDAAALGDAAQREHDRIDLVRVGIDASLALARGIAPLLVRPSQADQILGKQPTLNGSELAWSHWTLNTFITCLRDDR